MQRSEAFNGPKNYCFSEYMYREAKLKEKFEYGYPEKIIEDQIEALDWLCQNQLAEDDALEAKQKELERVVTSLLAEMATAEEAGRREAGRSGRPRGRKPRGRK